MIERFVLVIVLWMPQRAAQLPQLLSALAVDLESAIGAVPQGGIPKDVAHVMKHPHHRLAEWWCSIG